MLSSVNGNSNNQGHYISADYLTSTTVSCQSFEQREYKQQQPVERFPLKHLISVNDVEERA